MLGIAHIDVDKDDQHQHDDPAAVHAQNFRQTRARVKLRNDLRAGTAFPRSALQPPDHADDDVVHHERKQRLVGVPFGLEECRDERPHAACQRAGKTHDEKQHPRRHFSRPEQGEICRGNGAGRNLTLGTDVPEAHLEARRNGQRAAEQRHRDLDGLADGGGFAERTGDDRAVGRDGIHTHDADDKSAQNERQQNRAKTDAPHLPGFHAVALCKPHKRRFHFVMHLPAPFRRLLS